MPSNRSRPLLIAGLFLSGAAAPIHAKPAAPPASAQASAPLATTNAWWRAFRDPRLNAIVERVLAQNLDLAAAAARIAQARAAAGYARVEMLPSASLSAGVDHVSQSLHSPFGTATTQLGFPRAYDLGQVGGEASWEIDLFGRLRKQRRAALAELAASRDDAAALGLTLAAEATDAYLRLRGLQASLAIAERRVRTASQLTDLVADRVRNGMAPGRELDRAVGQREAAAAEIPALRSAIAGEQDRIDVLMGREAGAARTELGTVPADDQGIPEAIDPGARAIPAQLMRRRPDIVAAEQRAAAADARVGVALGEYYPHISLQGLLGVVSLGSTSLLSSRAIQADGGASLRWRLFDFGRVDAEVAAARGRKAEALAQYRSTVLSATAEVETALTDLEESRREIVNRESQIAALARARDQARLAYKAGATPLLDVLAAEDTVLAASDMLAKARVHAARASVASVRALGGGFEAGDGTDG